MPERYLRRNELTYLVFSSPERLGRLNRHGSVHSVDMGRWVCFLGLSIYGPY